VTNRAVGLPVAVGSCPACGKHSYSTRAAAKRAARAIHPGERLRAYRCGTYWHLTRIPRLAWKEIAE
jgi:hypothetical protein